MQTQKYWMNGGVGRREINPRKSATRNARKAVLRRLLETNIATNDTSAKTLI
jgi:hypothetical protein